LVPTAKNHEDSKLNLNCPSPSVIIQIPLYSLNALPMSYFCPLSPFPVRSIDYGDEAHRECAPEPVIDFLDSPTLKAIHQL
jgi:hypothetical protein